MTDLSRLRMLCAIAALGVCVQGCPPKFPKCDDDTQCTEHGMVCVNGTCKQCRDNGQCKPGYECMDNACVEKPECNVNDDCQNGLICKNHKCVPQCTSDTECKGNEKCQDNKCIPRPQCDDEHPCPDGKICQDNKCVEGPKGENQGTSGAGECTLSTVYFGFNEFSLTEQARTDIDKNAECIKKKSRSVTVEGNTDERGTDEYNITLGNRRADAVRRYLVNLGIPENQITIVSYGRERPADPGHTEQAWAKNRRADFVWR